MVRRAVVEGAYPLATGDWRLVAGDWWLVAGGWWLVADGWWLATASRPLQPDHALATLVSVRPARSPAQPSGG
ncbi:hypothetical protein CKO17_15000 [Marichromatium gracile]|nr:hypothetical protein [Marichromatium gracile]